MSEVTFRFWSIPAYRCAHAGYSLLIRRSSRSVASSPYSRENSEGDQAIDNGVDAYDDGL
jgi:hypothetical protein